MNDTDFLKAFESCTLPHDQFPRHAYICMAWLVLRRDGWEGGVQYIRDGIRRFASANGAAPKYHETITLFWARVVHHAIALAPNITDFEQFIAAYPHLLDTTIITQHYSREMLWSDAARHAWVEPDLQPLPADMIR